MFSKCTLFVRTENPSLPGKFTEYAYLELGSNGLGPTVTEQVLLYVEDSNAFAYLLNSACAEAGLPIKEMR
ncbi:MAG: hypothetical protein M3Y24_03430 [Acidobacteriota bacterium]|nr:hypothetical protein [Acidobacteriota bacterium]